MTPLDCLDAILGSRVQIRILRALFSAPLGRSRTARELARFAGTSHVGAAKALSRLEQAGIVLVYRARTHSLYDLNRDHFLAPSLELLFDEEMHAMESLMAFVRTESRKRAQLVRTDVELNADAVEITVRGRLDPLELDRVARELEEALRKRFSVTARVRTAPLPPGLETLVR